jgi:hypothetical protein
MPILFAWLWASALSLVVGDILRTHGCSICLLLECRRHSIQGTQALKLHRFYRSVCRRCLLGCRRNLSTCQPVLHDFPKLVLCERLSVIPSEGWLVIWPETVNFPPFDQGMYRAEGPPVAYTSTIVDFPFLSSLGAFSRNCVAVSDEATSCVVSSNSGSNYGDLPHSNSPILKAP